MSWGKKYKKCGCYTTLWNVTGELKQVTFLCDKHARIAKSELKVVK